MPLSKGSVFRSISAVSLTDSVVNQGPHQVQLLLNVTHCNSQHVYAIVGIGDCSKDFPVLLIQALLKGSNSN